MNQKSLFDRPRRYRSRPLFAAGAIALALSALAVALSAQGCRRFLALFHPPEQCSLDERPIHPEMKVRVLLEGKRKAADGCCIRCAINYAKQTGTTVHLLSVTDYPTRKPTDPERATYVTGSDFSPCAGSSMEASAGRREVEMKAWDRCAPSSVAFANPDDARDFEKLHGGRIQTWSQLVGANRVMPR